MDILNEICQRKAAHVGKMKDLRSVQDLQYMIEDKPLPSGFLLAMKKNYGPSIIAEVKKASPSKGVIREDFDPVEIAKIYRDNGAACLSVLTDEPYFQGHDDYVVAVKKAVGLPVLRKDFMIDEYQIYESRALGADCILLIMAALDDAQARGFYMLSQELGMDILVEVHNLEELQRALKLNPMMIGVNNRNLKTMVVDVQTSVDLSEHIPEETYQISESGIGDNKTILGLQDVGYKGFLVGESLMRENDIANALNTLLGK